MTHGNINCYYDPLWSGGNDASPARVQNNIILLRATVLFMGSVKRTIITRVNIICIFPRVRVTPCVCVCVCLWNLWTVKSHVSVYLTTFFIPLFYIPTTCTSKNLSRVTCAVSCHRSNSGNYKYAYLIL